VRLIVWILYLTSGLEFSVDILDMSKYGGSLELGTDFIEKNSVDIT
jgi:hypothetical protein